MFESLRFRRAEGWRGVFFFRYFYVFLRAFCLFYLCLEVVNVICYMFFRCRKIGGCCLGWIILRL